jgi:hypothetical protein
MCIAILIASYSPARAADGAACATFGPPSAAVAPALSPAPSRPRLETLLSFVMTSPDSEAALDIRKGRYRGEDARQVGSLCAGLKMVEGQLIAESQVPQDVPLPSRRSV